MYVTTSICIVIATYSPFPLDNMKQNLCNVYIKLKLFYSETLYTPNLQRHYSSIKSVTPPSEHLNEM